MPAQLLNCTVVWQNRSELRQDFLVRPTTADSVGCRIYEAVCYPKTTPVILSAPA